MKKLRVALIGAGMIAEHGHVPAYHAMTDDAEIVGVCDINGDVVQKLAKKAGIPHVFTDTERMLKEIKPDLVSVSTPNNMHYPLVKLALQHDADVICEKPLALRYADAKELFSLAKERKRLLAVSQTVRFCQEYFIAKEYVEDGILGDVYYAEINRIRRRGMPTWGTFHKKESSGGGAMADIGVHVIDALLWILGSPEVTSVSGTASNHIIKHEREVRYCLTESGAMSGVKFTKPFDPNECDVEEFAAGMIRTKQGISINFKIAWIANLPESREIKILGSKAGISLPDLNIYTTVGRNQVNMKPRVFELGPYDKEPFPGHYYMIKNVIRHLRNKEELLVRPEETLNVAAAIDLFYISAKNNREAFLKELAE